MSGRSRRSLHLLVACGGLAAAGAGAWSQTPSSVESPRTALASYLDHCRAGRYADAGRSLDVPPGKEAQAPELARKLKAVLDRHVWFDLDAVSDAPGGNEADRLPAGVDQVGAIPGSTGAPEAVLLVRAPDGSWRFSRSVVSRIEVWYGALPDRRLREILPEPLFRPGPRELLWWQWLALPVLAVVAWLAGRLLGYVTRRLVGRVASHTTTTFDDRVLRVLAAPVTLFWALVVLWLATPSLGLYAPAQEFVHDLLRGALLVTIFWGASRVIDVAAGTISTSLAGRSMASGLVPLGVRVAKVGVAAVAVVMLLSVLGYPVASLLAGLGLGGLAFALAAQKTVENLFGSISIAVDQPIKEGDFVRIDGDVGTVEAVGLRSTRIRTLDRTLVTLPNARLADMRLENFSVRDRMRLACTVSLEYGTTADQMRAVLAGLEEVLRAHPRIWPDAVVVRLKELAASSLDIEIMAWFQTPDWDEFQLIRQEILLQFMEVVEAAGAAFAFPTRTVHLVTEETG